MHDISFNPDSSTSPKEVPGFFPMTEAIVPVETPCDEAQQVVLEEMRARWWPCSEYEHEPFSLQLRKRRPR